MPGVTRADIQSGLRILGLAAGDTVMVHSSLSAFGWVEGGAATVVEALLEAVGAPAGTLIVPTFSKYLQAGETVWDRENTPSLMGAISETARKWPGALRSNHAAHPLAAIGSNAELVCRQPHQTGFGPDSPFKTMVQIDAWVLLMGVTYNNCTLMHLLEAEAQVPYRFLERRLATVVIDGVTDPAGGAWEYSRRDGAANDFMPLGLAMEKQGLVRIGEIGNAQQRLFRAADLYRLGSELMRRDPLYLLTPESRAEWRWGAEL